MMRIYLTGFMGAGKSTIGRRLASRLSVPFVDLDEAIEVEAGVAIDEIFAARGEAEFREIEASALEATRSFEDVVVATGGGTIAQDENLRLIQEAGTSVWIAPPLDVLFERVERPGRKQRPMYRSRAQGTELYESRLAAYGRADLRVELNGMERPQDVVERIVGLLKERQCDT